MYKIYQNGNEFIEENVKIFDSDPINLAFYYIDALEIKEFSTDNYIIKVYDDNNYLFMLKIKDYNLMIYGCQSLAKEAAYILRDYNLSFTELLCESKLGDEFLANYQEIYKGNYTVNLDMQLMKCDKVIDCDTSDIIIPDYDDLNEIYNCLVNFHLETNTKGITFPEFKKQFIKNRSSYRIIKVNDEIASIGKRRNVLNTASISNIYTNKKYRKMGYAKKIVSLLTNEILSED